ncbi:19600_t:CDS:2, partial [Racocetra fulgida]
LTEDLNSPEEKLKIPVISSVIVSFILCKLNIYLIYSVHYNPKVFMLQSFFATDVLINAAYIMVVPFSEVINPSDIIAINFGRKLWGEPGKIIISILISLSAFGCVDSIVFMGARAIVYAAKNGFISEKLSHKKHDAPFYALL